jgi:hypothetical protein
MQRIRATPDEAPDETKLPAKAHELVPLGRPPIILDEPAADYRRLFADHVADLKPRGSIERQYVEASVANRWEELRLRRVKPQVFESKCVAVLAKILMGLVEQPPIDDEEELERIEEYQDQIEGYQPQLAERNVIPPGYSWAQKALAAVEAALEAKRQAARKAHVDALVREWHKRDPAAVERVNEILANAGMTIDSAVVARVAQDQDIQALDQAIRNYALAYNAALLDLARHRTTFKQVLEGPQQPQIEDVDYHEVPPSQSAA